MTAERVQRELAEALAEHQVLVGPRDDQQPGAWFRWCICGWDGGRLAPGEASNDSRSYRAHIADALLSGLLAPLLAAQATVKRVEALAKTAETRQSQSLSRMFGGEPFPATVTVMGLRRALDGST